MKSPDEIRALFPALARVHRGHRVAYFDGPGGTQVPSPVVAAMTDYLLNHNANTHWLYPSSVETDAMLWAARESVADFLNSSPHDVSFGNNMTTITFHLARALGRAWGPGDEVIVTELDHHANVAPWRALAAERGITVHTARMRPEQGVLDWAHLESLVSAKTRLLAIGAASNALGTVNDIPRAAALARAVGALLFVDAVHYAAHGVIDVKAWDCDFLACSSYKFYGPHAGVLYARLALLDALDVPKLDPAPAEAPERIETGTQNHEGIVGMGAAVEFLASLSEGPTRRDRLVATMHALHERGELLLAQLWQGLSAIPGVTMYGTPPGATRTPTVSFSVQGRRCDDVARGLAESGVFASNGDFYATTTIERIGRAADGVVRAGCACYTTADEVTRLVDGVRRLA
ncbi:MAG: cysteine desulfurase-like protein [Gemmatimonadaceae bacterium]|nr:cysteine desulfurase-like protein [Gemmatimonadaceae bacterium]